MKQEECPLLGVHWFYSSQDKGADCGKEAPRTEFQRKDRMGKQWKWRLIPAERGLNRCDTLWRMIGLPEQCVHTRPGICRESETQTGACETAGNPSCFTPVKLGHSHGTPLFLLEREVLERHGLVFVPLDFNYDWLALVPLTLFWGRGYKSQRGNVSERVCFLTKD